MNSTLRLDTGSPFPLVDADGQLVLLQTFACAARGCSAKQLHVKVSAGEEDERGFAMDSDRTAYVVFDVATGALSTHDGSAASEALAEVTDPAIVERWVASHAEVLRERFETHRAQAVSSLRTRPVPSWAPGDRLYHGELYPGFTPFVKVDGTGWYILDAYCPDPACSCRSVTLELVRMDAEDEEILEVELDRATPLKASTRGKALWRAIHTDSALRERLEDRRTQVRGAGAYVLAEVYERARRERAKRNLERAPSPAGYLLNGAVCVSAIARMFDVLRELTTVGAWDCLRPDCVLRVDVSGPVHRTAWLRIDPLLESVALREAPTPDDETTPFVQLFLCPRSEVCTDHLRERCAYEWPLAPGGEVPLLERIDAEGEPSSPTAADTLFAVAASVALLEHADAIGAIGERQTPGEPLTPVSWESVVSLDEGDLHVRLTASDPSAPWPDPDRSWLSPITHEEDDEDDADDAGVQASAADDDEWDDDDEDDDEWDDDDGENPLRVAHEAFADWALTGGAREPEVRLALNLMGWLHDYARAEDTAASWYEPAQIEGFLRYYAPRKIALDDADVEGTPAALERIFEWLRATGHYDARTLAAARAAAKRTLTTFRSRMRDPRAFGLAKSLFSEMERAGIDLADEDAVQRYVEELNRREMLAERRAAPRRDAEPVRDIRERGAHRWQPAEGEKPPGPAEPCPCGSGRRYKKCCKPR